MVHEILTCSLIGGMYLNLLYWQRIPLGSFLEKLAGGLVPEQPDATVSVYKDALPYIRCELRSTIQHESGHRKDEETRNKAIIDQSTMKSSQVMPFQQFVNPSRAEPIAEKYEENCEPLLPQQLSGETVPVTLSQLLQEAVSESNIDSTYRSDVKAGSLMPGAAGMYQMQDLPSMVAVQPGVKPNSYRGFDGTLWVDVRKIVDPFLAKPASYPANVQTDGVTADPDKTRADAAQTSGTAGTTGGAAPSPSTGSWGSSPSVGSRPAVEAR